MALYISIRCGENLADTELKHFWTGRVGDPAVEIEKQKKEARKAIGIGSYFLVFSLPFLIAVYWWFNIVILMVGVIALGVAILMWAGGFNLLFRGWYSVGRSINLSKEETEHWVDDGTLYRWIEKLLMDGRLRFNLQEKRFYRRSFLVEGRLSIDIHVVDGKSDDLLIITICGITTETADLARRLQEMLDAIDIAEDDDWTEDELP